jgi:hyperosmotically inducible protein
VDNHTEVLPPSRIDERLRGELYRAIYGYEPLGKYAVVVNKPIHIIVRNGHGSLEGVVDSEVDRNLAGLQAISVPGTLSVTNDLHVQAKPRL